MRAASFLAAVFAMSVPRIADGHGSLVVPPPRNSVDRTLPMWAGLSHR